MSWVAIHCAHAPNGPENFLLSPAIHPKHTSNHSWALYVGRHTRVHARALIRKSCARPPTNLHRAERGMFALCHYQSARINKRTIPYLRINDYCAVAKLKISLALHSRRAALRWPVMPWCVRSLCRRRRHCRACVRELALCCFAIFSDSHKAFILGLLNKLFAAASPRRTRWRRRRRQSIVHAIARERAQSFRVKQ